MQPRLRQSACGAGQLYSRSLTFVLTAQGGTPVRNYRCQMRPVEYLSFSALVQAAMRYTYPPESQLPVGSLGVPEGGVLALRS